MSSHFIAAPAKIKSLQDHGPGLRGRFAKDFAESSSPDTATQQTSVMRKSHYVTRSLIVVMTLWIYILNEISHDILIIRILIRPLVA
jgi:hypothetical protein